SESVAPAGGLQFPAALLHGKRSLPFPPLTLAHCRRPSGCLPFRRRICMSGEGRLVLQDVVKVYRSGGGLFGGKTVVRAVGGVAITLAPGETLGIVGESGSGKSTLGRIAAGIETPTSGTVVLDGKPYARIGSAGWRRERRGVQMVFQNPSKAL